MLTGIGVLLGGAVVGGLGIALASTREVSEPASLLEASGTATVRWTASVPIAAPDTLVAAGAAVLVGGQDTVVALDARSGAPRWQFGTAGPGSGRVCLAVDDDTVGVSGAGFVAGLDPATGLERWRQEVGFVSGLAVGPGTVHVGVGTELHAFDAASGTALWTHELEGPYPMPDGSPLIAGDLVVAFDGKEVRALDIATGLQRWRHLGHGYGAAAVDGTVYLRGAEGFAALDGESGIERWRCGIDLHPAPVPVIVADGTIVLQDRDGYSRSLDAATGVPRWGPVHWIPPRTANAAIAFISPSSLGTSDPGDRHVYAGYPTGRVIAAEAATGMPTWVHDPPPGSGLPRAVDVSDGVAYTLTTDGRVCAVGP